ncbi:MAG: divalent-cation tolerance protein CutA [Planctomycetota bacterium]
MARTKPRPAASRPRRAPALRIVLTTVPPRRAPALARALVEARAAACVQAVPGVRSTYRWKGEVRADGETLLLVKTTRGTLPRCLDVLRTSHPYDVPEIVVVTPSQVARAYDAWAAEETTPARHKR